MNDSQTSSHICLARVLKNGLLIKAELPGLEPKDIEVNITGDVLKI